MIEKLEHKKVYYQFKKLNEIDYINHLFTTRIGWEASNTDTLADIFKTSKENIIGVKQVHGTNILVIDEEYEDYDKIRRIKADGLITNIPNLVLTTYHADCGPLFLLDIENRVIGMAHAGWRGTFDNIAGKMVDKMRERYGSHVKNILVGIGPSIGSCCYEIGEDVKDSFLKRYVEFPDIIDYRNGKYYLDLWKLNYLQLEEKGISKGNIILSKICTSCKVDSFYSYRKEKGNTGRMIAAISIIK